MPATEPAIICLAHLGWDWVWQRPQHLLSRLAQHYPVLYINEPYLGDADLPAPVAQRVADTDHLRAIQPIFPDRAPMYAHWQAEYTALVQQQVIDRGWAVASDHGVCATRPLIGWFYTPTPVYLLDHLPFDVVVYDVMDELANFKGAGADLIHREAMLLKRADLVFTGGRSLYEARVDRHPHVHLFASGVDPQHFRRASDPTTPVAPELAALPAPILGFYGVIDERIDLDLIDRLAAACPSWSIVMVGPVAKIDPTTLPQRPNLHFLGQQPYAKLPQFLKGFDVCLMPFAINEATRSISPTKTLEYMAAPKPIVSTPVPDVVHAFSDSVQIAADVAGFRAAIERVLRESAEQRRTRELREAAIVARNTWDAMADQMRRTIAAARQARASR